MREGSPRVKDGGVTVSPASVLAPPRPIEIDQRPDKRSGKACWGPCFSRREGEQVTGSLTHSLGSGCAGAGSLHGCGQGRVRGSGCRGFRRFAHLLLVLCAGRLHSNLLLLPTPCSLLQAPHRWQLGFSVPFTFRIQTLTTCACTQLFLAPCSLCYYLASRGEVCPGASTAAKGPRPSLSREDGQIAPYSDSEDGSLCVPWSLGKPRCDEATKHGNKL